MKLKFLFPLFFTFLIIFLFYVTHVFVFKLYPVVMNFTIFTVFFSSIFTKETIIQKFAKMFDGELSDFAKNYTRKLTYVWAVFLFINFSISLATIFMPDKIWMIYNGCISYILVGTFFVIEYIIRVILRKKYDKI